MKTLREYIDQLDEISRRDFIKGAGAAAVAGTGGYIAGTQNQLDKRIGHNLGRLYGFMHNANTFGERSRKINAINDRLKYFEKRLDPDIDRTEWYKYGFGQGQSEYKRIFPNGHTSTPADESKFDELLNAYFENFAQSAYGGLKEEEVDEAASPNAVRRIEQLVQYK